MCHHNLTIVFGLAHDRAGYCMELNVSAIKTFLSFSRFLRSRLTPFLALKALKTVINLNVVNDSCEATATAAAATTLGNHTHYLRSDTSISTFSVFSTPHIHCTMTRNDDIYLRLNNFAGHFNHFSIQAILVYRIRDVAIRHFERSFRVFFLRFNMPAADSIVNLEQLKLKLRNQINARKHKFSVLFFVFVCFGYR